MYTLNKPLANKISLFLLVVLLVAISINCVIIPQESPDRNWYDVNKYNEAHAAEADHVVLDVPAATGDPVQDYNNITAQIADARKIHESTPTRYVVIRFKQGQYVVGQSINLSINTKDSYLIFEGAKNNATGLPETTIDFQDSQNVPKSYLFHVLGSASYHIGKVDNYDESQNAIAVSLSNKNISEGDIVDITISNGSWHNNMHKPDQKNYFGQINKVKAITGDNNISLELPFNAAWKFKESDNTCDISIIRPIKCIGFENLNFKYDVKVEKPQGSFIDFQASAYCWVNNLNCFKPLTSHIGISRSFSDQVTDSYFDSANNFGPGGEGYGVALGARTSNCKVENNIFNGLRHAMEVATAANNNVFGYNYSLNQDAKDANGNELQGLGDLSLHGFYPYSNLFEGNVVCRIRADEYWGGNGGNTFFKNWVQTKDLDLGKSRNNVVIDNDADVKVGNRALSLLKSNESGSSVANDVNSYYYQNEPAFFKSAGVTWPYQPDGSGTQDIPAVKRYDKYYSGN